MSSLVQTIGDSVPQSVHDAFKAALKLLKDLSVNQPILSKAMGGAIGCSALFLCTQIVRRTFYSAYFKYKKYPPGPIGIPILGCFLSRWNLLNFYAFPTMMGKNYGPVSMYPNGPWYWSVMINDKKLIDKYSRMHAFMDRPPMWEKATMPGVPANFSAMNGHAMMDRRKLFQSTIIRMTDSRFFTEFVQKHIKQNILFPDIDDAIAHKNGKWNPWNASFCYTFNTVYGASFGPESILDPKDELYLEFKKITEDSMAGVLFLFMLTSLAPNYLAKKYSKDADGTQRKLRSILMQWIVKREKAQIKSDEPSYIDMMFESGLDRESIISDVLAAFQAGAHTTAASITMQLFMLAKHPEIQEKIYKELRQLNGDKDELALINKEDFKKLHDGAHLLRAFIEEVWRLSLTGMGNPRQLQDDFKMEVEVDGKKDYYMLPKGAFIDFNGPSLVRSEKMGWKKPLEFAVENYLDKNGEFGNPAGGLNAFGYGKRNCPAMAMARKENFFAVAMMVYHYRVCGPKGDGDVDFEINFFGNPSFPLSVFKR